MPVTNPFRVYGVVSRPEFTDREREVQRIRKTLDEPGAKLLLYGERRMGKTSALRVAMEEHIADGGAAFLADFSTATSHADIANRILDAATRALGRRWRDIAMELTSRIGLKLEIAMDPATQVPSVSLGVGAREAPVSEQRDTLARVLDSLEAICVERRASLGVILDEFQEIHRLGGEDAEWHLRGVIQHHQRLSYVVAGSRPHLLLRMISSGRAFYKLFDVLEFGPIDPAHLAGWIDEGLKQAKIPQPGTGAEMIGLAGPRTRDVVQLARKAFDIAAQGGAGPDLVANAFLEVVQDESGPLDVLWSGLSPVQQNVLRAVAAGASALTSADTLRKFGLRSSAAVAKAVASLVRQGVLQQLGAGRYRFDSPFQRGWVIVETLPDMGLHLPATFVPDVDRVRGYPASATLR